jgi:hypothetical protein
MAGAGVAGVARYLLWYPLQYPLLDLQPDLGDVIYFYCLVACLLPYLPSPLKLASAPGNGCSILHRLASIMYHIFRNSQWHINRFTHHPTSSTSSIKAIIHTFSNSGWHILCSFLCFETRYMIS